MHTGSRKEKGNKRKHTYNDSDELHTEGIKNGRS